MKQSSDLKQFFYDSKTYEKKARDFYFNLTKQLSDKSIIKVLDKIRLDEEKHMKIAEELMILSEGQKIADVKTAISKFSLDLSSSNSFLLISNVENYLDNIIGLLKSLETQNKEVLCVSVNKSKQDISNAFKKMNAEIKNLRVIDCFSDNIDPKNLTSIEINLLKAIKKSDESVVLFDTISFLSIYHSTNLLREFSRALISLAKKHDFKLVLSLIEEESDKQLIASLSTMVDQIVK